MAGIEVQTGELVKNRERKPDLKGLLLDVPEPDCETCEYETNCDLYCIKRKRIHFSNEEIGLFLQWGNNVEDVNPEFLEKRDYALIKRLYEYFNRRTPHSVLRGLGTM